MRFDLFFLVSLLPAAALASEAVDPAAPKKNNQDKNGNPVSPGGRPNDRAGAAPGGNTGAANLCGSSSFSPVPIDLKKVEKPPTKEDALTLAGNVGQSSHRWNIPTSGREIVRYGTVAFFAKAVDQRAAIGNADVSNLLEDAANHHSQSEYISVEGTYKQFVNEEGDMACDDDQDGNGLQAIDVHWRIGPPSNRYPTDSA